MKLCKLTYFLVMIGCLLAATKPCCSQAPDTIWTKLYGGSSNDYGWDVRQLSDSSFITTGYTYSYGVGNADVWLIKLNSSGNQIWNFTYGGTGLDVGYAVRQTFDGGYVIAGCTASYGAGGQDFWLVKMTASGIQQWSQTYGGSGDEWAHCVEQTPDSGYIIAGWTNSYGAGNRDFWLIKTNANGDSLWKRTFGGINLDYGMSVQPTTDGGYIATGYTWSFGAGSADVWLIKVSAAGDSLWSKTFGGSQYDAGRCVQQTTDGGFIIAGETYSFGAGSYDAWLIKTNANGDSIWSRFFGGSNVDYAQSVQQTTDGGYILAGWSASYSGGNNDVWMVKTDSLGITQWSDTFGGSNTDEARSVRQTLDGGYIVAGYTASYGAGNKDFWLIRLEGPPPPQPQIALSTTSLDFDSVLVGSGDSLSLTIRNLGGAQLVITAIALSDSVFSTNFSVADSLIAANDSLVVAVFFEPDAAIAYSDTLTIQNNDMLVTVFLQGVGVLPPEAGLTASQDTLNFGSVVVADSVNLPLMLYNLSDSTIVLYNLINSSPSFSNSFSSADSLLTAGDSLQISVTFSPMAISTHLDILTISSSADTLEVILQGLGIGPIVIALIPYNPPITIPEAGGSFALDITLYNDSDSTQTFDIWCNVEVPGCSQFTAQGPVSLMLNPGGSIVRLRTQTVPAEAPGGNYQYWGFVGTYPWSVANSDSFTFTKAGVGGVWNGPTGWENSGELFPGEEQPQVVMPLEIALSALYPNPFNTALSIQYALPEPTEMRLTLLSIAGKRVCLLAEGWHEAGTHRSTFELGNLPSGVYIVHLQANSVQIGRKVVLLK
ncbi:MAG: choice-of-anchor D domain-containing protein [bacterium]